MTTRPQEPQSEEVTAQPSQPLLLATDGRTTPIRRGIVVTHGVGEQRRADQLDTVVEPLVAFLGQALGHSNVRLIARTQLDSDRVASATLHLTRPGTTEPEEEWHVREAWWARSFRPSDSGSIMGWAVRAFAGHAAQTLRVLARSTGWVTGAVKTTQGQGVWEIPTAGRGWAVVDVGIWLVITAGTLLVYLVGLVAVPILYVLVLFPASFLFPTGVQEILVRLTNFFTGGIGDQYAITNRTVAVAGAANTVATALQPFLDPEGQYLKRRKYVFDTVTIVAHSGGNVVTYEALAGDEVQDWLRTDPPHYPKERTPRRVTWVSVGSGLNLAWRMRARNKGRDRAFFGRPLDAHVNCIDLYGRYDPVPQGAAPEGLVRALMGAPDGGGAGPTQRPYVSVRVANRDWPFTEHGAYWWNREEVLSRIVHAISDSRLGASPLDPSPADPEATYSPHILSAAIRSAVAAGGAHRRALLRSWVLTLPVGALVALVFWRGSAPTGSWVASWAGLDFLLPRSPGGHTWQDLVRSNETLVGALVLICALLVLTVLWGLLQRYREWRRREPDAQPLPW